MTSQTLLQKDLGLFSPDGHLSILPPGSQMCKADGLTWDQNCRHLPNSREGHTPSLEVISAVLQPSELYLTRIFWKSQVKLMASHRSQSENQLLSKSSFWIQTTSHITPTHAHINYICTTMEFIKHWERFHMALTLGSKCYESMPKIIIRNSATCKWFDTLLFERWGLCSH